MLNDYTVVGRVILGCIPPWSGQKISLHLIFRSIRVTAHKEDPIIQYGLFGITFIKDHK